jgi:alkylation response protein AidB-like acyl-CoA dehydrogenase
MDFTLTEEQVELAALTRRILAPDRPVRTLWKELGAAGILDPSLGLLQQCSVLVEVGRAAAQIPYLPSVFVAASALRHFGVATDKTAAPFFMVVPEAEVIVVPDGDSVALVPADGVEMRRLVDGSKQNILEAQTSAPAARWMLERATIGICAQQLGVLERALEMTAAYACTRVQFGRPIGTFQAVAQRLADAYIDVEAVRLTMWQAAWRLSEGRPCAAEIATAKFWAADAGHRVAHTTVHIHGGVGIDLESPVHRYFVMAKRLEFTLGHATDQLRALGSLL